MVEQGDTSKSRIMTYMNQANIPKDVCLIILEFCGMVKNRNGVYIGQIAKNNVIYSQLQSIPTKKDSFDGKVITGSGILELKVDFIKTIDNIKNHFLIYRVISYGNDRKCHSIIETIVKFRKGKLISRGLHECV